MVSKNIKVVFALVLVATLLLTACAKGTSEPAANSEESEKFVFGMLLVGAYNDQGWTRRTKRVCMCRITSPEQK